jgi:hypothetical protein
VAVTDSSKVPGGWLAFWLGILATAAVLAALVVAWPDDDARAVAATQDLTPTTWAFAPAVPELPDFPDLPLEVPGATAQLFVTGLPEAMAEIVAAAGGDVVLYDVAVYPSYVITTLETPQAGPHRWTWAGHAAAEDQPLAAPVDLAERFSPAEIDLTRIPALVEDAPSHYSVPTVVTHVLIARPLPFDERVLVRVYAVPTEGSPTSGGGYVSYTPDGTLVQVCC